MNVTRIGPRQPAEVLARLNEIDPDEIETIVYVVELKGDSTQKSDMKWDGSGQYRDMWYSLGWLNKAVDEECFPMELDES